MHKGHEGSKRGAITAPFISGTHTCPFPICCPLWLSVPLLLPSFAKVFEFIARYPWDPLKQCPIQTNPIGCVKLANEILHELSAHCPKNEYTAEDTERLAAFDRPRVMDGIEGIDWSTAAATNCISEYPDASTGIQLQVPGVVGLTFMEDWEARSRGVIESHWQDGWEQVATEAAQSLAEAEACSARALAEEVLRKDAEYWQEQFAKCSEEYCRAQKLRDLQEAEMQLHKERVEWLRAKVLTTP